MIGKQLQQRLSQLFNFRRICRDTHMVLGHGAAGGNGLVLAFDADQTQPASAIRLEPLVMAQRRNLNASQASAFEDRSACGGLDGFAVNDYVRHALKSLS